MISAMSIETITKKLFTVDEYLRIWEVGILPEDGRFELIRGEIIEMPVPSSQHNGRVIRLNHLFTSRLEGSVLVGVQGPLFLDRHSLPIPDVTLLRPRSDFYTVSHPTASDVLLVVEVSHTTVWYDSKHKASLYAEAGITEYWQLDVTKETLIIRREPVDSEYRNVQILHRGETIRLQNLPQLVFSTDEIIG